MLRRFLIVLLMVFISIGNSYAQEEGVVVEKHNPKRATLYSAVLPGLGQAYNKKYWKIPVVYAGIGTIGYFAITNGNYYNDDRQASAVVPD